MSRPDGAPWPVGDEKLERPPRPALLPLQGEAEELSLARVPEDVVVVQA
jgi:hypothetical protein